MGTKMKTLVIYEQIPDDCYHFVFDDKKDKDIIALAVASAGCYINADDLDENHPIFTLNKMLDAIAAKQGEKVSARSVKKPIKGPFSKVIVCGFCL